MRVIHENAVEAADRPLQVQLPHAGKDVPIRGRFPTLDGATTMRAEVLGLFVELEQKRALSGYV